MEGSEPQARENLARIMIAAEYLIEGRSIAWITREFDLPHGHGSYLAALLGLTNKRRSPEKDVLDKYDQVERALLEGWPIGEICKTFEVSRGAVDRWFPDRRKLTPQEVGELAQIYIENNKARMNARRRGKWTEMLE